MVRGLQKSVMDGKVEQYVKRFLEGQLKGEETVPKWINVGLELAGFDFELH